MGEKRNYDDAGGAPAGKRYKGAHQKHPDFKKNTPRPESNTWAKKRLRTIERRLRNLEGLPGHVQVEMRREQAALHDQLAGKQEKKQRAHMISKYHMLRFFERKKAERLTKQLTRRLREATDADERAQVEAGLAIAEIDALYARYYPFMENYISLYPKKAGDNEKDDKDDKDDADDASATYGNSSAAKALRSARPPMWTEIKDAYASGGLKALEAIRDRPAAGRADQPAGLDTGELAAYKKEEEKSKKEKKEKKDKEKKKNKKDKKDKDKKTAPADDDDDDEGGFFE